MRQLNFQALTIRRMASHSILEKQPTAQTSIADVTDELLDFTYDLQQLILSRLQAALGRKGKGFYLEIADSAPSSFFGQCVDLEKVNDPTFLKRSQNIAHLLAGSQNRSNIKAGDLYVIEAVDSSYQNSPVYIVIKAEPHEGVRRNKKSLEHLKDIVLSPSQKLYKVGVLYKDENEGKTYPNDSFSAYLFDEQFGSGSQTLSSYFYKEFLRFDYTNNGPIQTKIFYDKTRDFIDKNIKDEDKREELGEALRVLLKTDNAQYIRPKEFAQHYLETDEQQALFNATVSRDFPPMVEKNSQLVDFSLKTRKIRFGDAQVSAPDSNFNNHIQVIKSQNDLMNLDPSDDSYTILKVAGKPNSVKRTK
ncbi:nucleoid-associated protein [Hymenobacter fodinae]|uniref:Nucleoid associated protein NdpA n=1 Tax=Hymenobacter fodinae TaxID=2510796 RepID=A0A4Z0NY92_9BACT|nr:nucleoid-associated protein [Hymenobacter fodinae]TGE03330.1 hypothetical protein EU556_25785 [Hymenobacter fodinae]